MAYQAEKRIKRALISVSDSTDLVSLARFLSEKFEISIVATHGTGKLLQGSGIPTESVESVTGSESILDGRVKTLHPKIHGGLLFDPSRQSHIADRDRTGLQPFDLLISNLYPFGAVMDSGATTDEIFENIDIGGVAMLRAAAKNCRHVVVVSDPADYGRLMEHMLNHDGACSAQFHNEMAIKAFQLTAEYDTLISHWMSSAISGAPSASSKSGDTARQTSDKKCDTKQGSRIIPDNLSSLNLSAPVAFSMRYGENSHQEASAYVLEEGGILSAKQVQGKLLSYNNILDADITLQLISEFRDFQNAAVAIVKHGTPCGVAIDSNLTNAFVRARACDPISSFGGIVGLSKAIDEQTAEAVAARFFDLIVAPDATEAALNVLKRKPDMRVLLTGTLPDPAAQHINLRSVKGGLLLQSADNQSPPYSTSSSVAARNPSPSEVAAMHFAMRVCKYVRSNAIVISSETAIDGIGGGQTSRLDSTHTAAKKALCTPIDGVRVAASDAFFPNPDALATLVEAGVSAVIHPGGSKRDEIIIEAANQANLAMLFTQIRHFKH